MKCLLDSSNVMDQLCHSPFLAKKTGFGTIECHMLEEEPMTYTVLSLTSPIRNSAVKGSLISVKSQQLTIKACYSNTSLLICVLDLAEASVRDEFKFNL